MLAAQYCGRDLILLWVELNFVIGGAPFLWVGLDIVMVGVIAGK